MTCGVLGWPPKRGVGGLRQGPGEACRDSGAKRVFQHGARRWLFSGGNGQVTRPGWSHGKQYLRRSNAGEVNMVAENKRCKACSTDRQSTWAIEWEAMLARTNSATLREQYRGRAAMAPANTGNDSKLGSSRIFCATHPKTACHERCG